MTGEAGLVLLAWALARWLDLSPLASLHPRPPDVLVGLVTTLPLLLGLAWMLNSALDPVRRLVTLVVDQIGPLVGSLSLLELGLVAAVAGFSEEILFRGVVQAALSRWLSETGGLLLSSLAFGLAHFASRTYAVFAAAMGLYLGTLFLVQGGLLAPMITHALYDFTALVCVARRFQRSQTE